MKKEEFYYDSRDGKRNLHAIQYLPDNPDDICCVVQIVHGMAEYFERYEEFAKFLTDRGCVVVGNDHLGHGKSVGENGTYGYFCSQDPATVVVRDVHRLKKITEVHYPTVPYILMGHSMGSFIARNYMMRYGSGIAGVIIMGTGQQPGGLLAVSKCLTRILKLIQGGHHESKFLDKLAFGSYNAKIENPRTNFDWLTRENDRVDKYVADPLCGFTFTVNGFATLFELLSRLNKEELLEKIPNELPVLMVSGDADPVGNYGKGVRQAKAGMVKAGVKNITLKLYKGARHELLNETNRAEVMQDIFDWMEGQILEKR